MQQVWLSDCTCQGSSLMMRFDRRSTGVRLFQYIFRYISSCVGAHMSLRWFQS